MDKQLLNALNNLSDALEQIAAQMSKGGESKSDVTKALQSGNFIEEIKEINIGVKSIKKDTQEILKQQRTILEMSKKKESDKKTGDFESDPKKENSIKKGVATILLIAVAVLAIGLAFKIVGKVDFLSVVGLGIAIVLIGMAFEKIAKLNITVRQAINTSIIMISMSFGIMLSSKILSFVSPISITQAITSVLISGMFAIASGGLVKLIQSFESSKLSFGTIIKTAIMLPLVMLSFSIGIWLSSLVLGKVQPIGLAQVMSSIFIAAVFSVAAFGLRKILKSFDGLSPGKALLAAFMMPFVFVALSISIWLSSKFLGMVQPISFQAFVGSIMIAALFFVLSFSIGRIATALGKLDWKDVPKIPAFFVLVSIAIAASAYIFWKSREFFNIEWITMIRILAIGVVVGILGIIFGFATKIIGDLTWPNVVKLPLFFTLIVISITISAYILYNYQKYFQIDFITMLKILVLGAVLGIIGIIFGIATKIIGNISWSQVIKLPVFFTLITLSIAISAMILFAAKSFIEGMTFTMMFKTLVFSVILAIAVVVIAIAAKILTLMGSPMTYMKGGLAILIIALVITLTSMILNEGEYKNYPGLKWVIGVGASMVAFGIAAALLGLAVFGPQALIFAAGLAAILVVAATIVETSKIIAKGSYNIPGILPWAVGVALIYSTFTPIIIALGALGLAGGVMKFFGADDPFEKAKGMMIQIAETIVDVAGILAKGTFTGGPTVEWASGISIALGAFSPLYTMLMANGVMKIFGGGGVGPDDFSNAIKTVSDGIIYAAKLFGNPENKSVWTGGPPKEWAEGVGTAIGAFSPVLKILSDGAIISLFGGKGVDAEAMKGAIKSISEGIVEAAYFFSKNSAPFLENYPKKEWGEGVGAALNAFAPVFTALSGKSWFSSGDDVIKDMKSGILHIGDAIVKVALMLDGGTLIGGIVVPGKAKPNFGTYPTKEWAEGIKVAVETFTGIFKSLEENGSDIATFTKQSNMLSLMLRSMSVSALIIHKSKAAFSTTIPVNWIKNLIPSVIGFALLGKTLESILTTTEKLTKTESGLFSTTTTTITVKKETDISIVARTAASLVMVARILHNNAKFFKFKIDPNFMSSVGSNILSFAILTKRIGEMEGKGGLGGMLQRISGKDPMSQMADGLVKVAIAYDILAKSLTKFGDALSSIDSEKVTLIRRLTGNIAVLSSMDSEMFSRVMSVLESRASVFSRLVDADKGSRISVGDKKEQKESGKKDKSGYGTVSSTQEKTGKQLDEIIKILRQINYNTSGIDEWLASQNFGPDETAKLK